ncbi:hypothetical protein PAPYR_488 [Paratrimastix pyriformis]|uniref:MCM OB domain-containing protein n=1 Tax=Paratrimastix pyriformis TaxID=342808 RepID=A0ABQ8UVM3_9EUKA|nr:hypothetical protein PAPYR_488 [Paratrimastix pyriformis]
MKSAVSDLPSRVPDSELPLPSDMGFGTDLGLRTDLLTEDPGAAHADTDGTTQHIWGTEVSIVDTIKEMRDFIDTFPDPRSGEPGLYLKRLDEIIAQELWTIPVDAQHVLPQSTYPLSPDPPIPDRDPLPDSTFSKAALQQYEAARTKGSEPGSELVPGSDLGFLPPAPPVEPTRPPEMYDEAYVTQKVGVQCFRLKEIKHMRGLHPLDIDKMVAVEGIVIRTGSLIPEIREVPPVRPLCTTAALVTFYLSRMTTTTTPTPVFQCTRCGNCESHQLERSRVVEPSTCSSCRTPHSMTLSHVLSKYANKQVVKLQEAVVSMTLSHVLSKYANKQVVKLQEAVGLQHESHVLSKYANKQVVKLQEAIDVTSKPLSAMCPSPINSRRVINPIHSPIQMQDPPRASCEAPSCPFLINPRAVQHNTPAHVHFVSLSRGEAQLINPLAA